MVQVSEEDLGKLNYWSLFIPSFNILERLIDLAIQPIKLSGY